MKIFAVALVLLVVKGTQGRVINQDESISNKSASWDLQSIGNHLSLAVMEFVAQSEVAKSIISNLTDSSRSIDDLIEKSVQELSSLVEDVQWKEVSISKHLIAQVKAAHNKLAAVGTQLHEAIGNETAATIHEQLVTLHNDISQNLSLIIERFNQKYEYATQQVEEWNKQAIPFTEAVGEEITQQIEQLKTYLSPMVQKATEEINQLIKEWNATPLPTVTP